MRLVSAVALFGCLCLAVMARAQTDAFPRLGASLPETLAGVHLPHDLEHNTLTEVRDLHVYPLAGDHAEIRAAALQKEGADWSADYLVVAGVACDSPNTSPHIVVFSGQGVSWYRLQGGKLAAWSHLHWATGCRGTRSNELGSDFAATRPAVLEILSGSFAGDPPEELLPAVATAAAPEECPGMSDYTDKLRDAVVAARSTSMRAIFASDITATLHLDDEGKLSVEKLRPVEGGPARQIIQDVRKVSVSPDRPVPPDCARGKTFDVVIPR
jgi:hypothetical protein